MIQLTGVALLLLALMDVFLTVLYSRTKPVILSQRLCTVIWKLMKQIARCFPRKYQQHILTFAGPVMVVVVPRKHG
ncbi:MAG: hypothetical protein ACR2IE_18795 [Candidatus Sumerlaeaceae bacterium]